MERIWLKSYPAGVPADIDPNQYRSLVELFDGSIRQFADRPAYHSMGKHISFGELEKLSRGFGGGMLGPTVFGAALDLAGGQTSPFAWACGYAAIGAGCLCAPLVARLFRARR